MQYTIEARQLTHEFTQRPSVENDARRTTVEASDAGEALSAFVRESEYEVVSFQPIAGRESIATVKRNEAVFLVRVYAN